MNLARLADGARLTLAAAHERAVDLGAEAVDGLHLFLALLDDDELGLTNALMSMDTDVQRVRSALEARPSSTKGRGRLQALDISADLDTLLEDVWRVVQRHRRHLITPIDFIDGLLGEDTVASLRDRLIELGVRPQDIEKAAATVRSRMTRAEAGGSKARNLLKYSRCLTDMAGDGLLDPVIGRHEEVQRLMQVLCRRVKNNPVLIGQPGIGKATIVEALAMRIHQGDVPAALRGRSIYALDTGAVFSGSEFRGVLEERLKGALDDAREARGDVILFIDDLSALGRGGVAGEVANVLKPALASGELRCIGVTTLDGYRNSIEKDGALERRFQPILVEEPSIDETVSILRGLRSRYEAHHDIDLTDGALVAAATLSHRFVTGRLLPDKAIDVMDEAAARLRIEREIMPADIDALARRAQELELEAAALSTNGSAHASKLRAQVEEMKAQVRQAQTEWAAQRDEGHQVDAGRKRLAWLRLLDSHKPKQSIRVALRRSIKEVGTELAKHEASLAQLHRVRRLYKVEMDEEEIAQVVASWTGVPLHKLMEDERDKLLNMEQMLHRRVVGQDQAIRAVANAVRLARAGMKDPNRPIGSFLFLGPTGVGKTELARAVAEFLFDDETAMVRIDMSEYMEKHAVSRLIGAPPGYIGYEDSGQLTEAVRRRPYSVVLFDEIEKAHPDVFNILLQIMDEGRLTDGHGRTVDFKNALVCMTSNVGGHLYQESLEDGSQMFEEAMQQELRATFRPEFLNRIDAIVRFDALSLEQIKEIVSIQIELVNRRLAGGGIRLEMDASARRYLGEKGFDPLQGARSLKRLIQHEVLEPLAKCVLIGDFKDGDVVALSMSPQNVVQLRRKAKATRSRPKKARAVSTSQSTNGAVATDGLASSLRSPRPRARRPSR